MGDTEVKLIVKAEDQAGPTLIATEKALDNIAASGITTDAVMKGAADSVNKAEGEFVKLVVSGKATTEELQRTADNVQILKDRLADMRAAAQAAADAEKAAADQAKEAATSVKALGDSAGQTVGNTDTLTRSITNMGDRRLANAILAIGSEIGKVGEIANAVATGDIKTFEEGISAASHAAVSVVSVIAPEFAPIVAVLSVVIGKFAAWVTGIGSTSEAIKQMTEDLKDQTHEIENWEALAKSRSMTSEEIFKIEQESYKKRIAANNQAFSEMYAAGQEGSAEWVKLNQETNDLRAKSDENANKHEVELRKQDQKDAEASAEATAKGIEFRNEERIASDKKRAKAASDAAKEQAKSDEELTKQLLTDSKSLIKDGKDRQKIADDVAKGIAKAAADIEKSGKKEVKDQQDVTKLIIASRKQNLENQKKDIAEEVKAEQEKAKTIIGITKTYIGIIVEHHASMKDMLKALGEQILQDIEAAGEKQVASAIETAGKKKAASLSSIPAESAEANSFLPFPASQIATAAAIAALTALAGTFIGGFADGGSVASRLPGGGRPPGLGSGENYHATMNSEEGVVTGDGMRTTIGQLLGLINQGGKGSVGQGAPAATGGGALDLDVRVSFVEPTSTLVRELMKLMNIEVLRNGVPLTASSFHHTVPLRRKKG